MVVGIDSDMFAEMEAAAGRLALLIRTVGRCGHCSSDHVQLTEWFEEGPKKVLPYGECRNCGNAWRLDWDDISPDVEVSAPLRG